MYSFEGVSITSLNVFVLDDLQRSADETVHFEGVGKSWSHQQDRVVKVNDQNPV